MVPDCADSREELLANNSRIYPKDLSYLIVDMKVLLFFNAGRLKALNKGQVFSTAIFHQ